MRILVLQHDYFGDLWRAAGHETITCGDEPGKDFTLPGHFVNIETILGALGPGRCPDVVFWGDDGGLARILGLERCPIPKVMWSIDTHHHVDWHALYAEAFDLVFIAQLDYLPAFQKADGRVEWLPLHATPETIEPLPDDKRYDVSFVGTLDPVRNPQRVRFLAELGLRVPMHVAHGGYCEIFRRSRIILNQTASGDLNFRVFQALACGSLLLTERTTNGLFDLFEENVHLVTYHRGDVDAAAAQVERYLCDPTAREGIALAGWREVRRRHLRSHRARTVLDAMEGLVAEDMRRPGINQYRVHASMSLMCLHLSHRMEEWSRMTGKDERPSPEDATAAQHRRNLATCYLDLATRYLHSAARLSPRDALWRKISTLMDEEYGRLPHRAIADNG